MRLKLTRFVFLCLIQFPLVVTTLTKENVNGKKVYLSDLVRSKRQNGYGNGMWNNGGDNGNFPMGGNWNGNGPNSNGYNGAGPQGPPPDDSIKGSIGTAEEKKPEDTQNQNQNGMSGGQEGQGPWWPNGNQNGYNNGPNQNGYNGQGQNNGYNNGPMPFNGNMNSNMNGNGNSNGSVDDEIKGSIGAAPEPTQAPFSNGYGFGSRGGYGNNNGYGNNGNQGFGFNRMSGYGNNFGRPILPRGERFVHGRGGWRY